MKRLNVTLASLFTASCLFAQVTLLEEEFSPTGVSNEGHVVGYYDQQSPYYLWNLESDEITEIGGVSAGNGIGGQATFSADGKYVAASMWTNWSYNKEWQKTSLTDYPYTYSGMCSVPRMKSTIFAVGQDTESGKGVVLSTSNGQWNKVIEAEKGLEDICFLNEQTAIVVGKEGLCAYTTTRGTEWNTLDARPKGSTDIITSYKAIDFMQEEPYYGVIGAELADGKFTAYQSPDGGESWVATEGVTGIPLCITHIDNIFFMGTQSGQILKSTDHGITWTKIFQTGGFLQPTIPIYSIKFADAKVGIATANEGGFVYLTKDGGKTWTIKTMYDRNDSNLDKLKNVSFYDAIWEDGNHVTIVGSQGYAYSSADKGETWTQLNLGSEEGNDLFSIALAEEAITVGSNHGTLFFKSSMNEQTVGNMGRYDIKTGEWTPLGSLGYVGDNSASSGYAISGDGKTVVGLASTHTPNQATINTYAHAVAWSEDKGMIDLGSLFANIGRSTRANAVSYDGSVIVGWQDEKGPWYSAVWRKNAEGGYEPNEYILIDKDSPSNEKNHALEARAVSLDGKWIGGRGKSISIAPLSVLSEDELIANQAWIWSEESGFMRLGMISELEGNGDAMAHVTGINNDGTTAVGFIVVGNFMYGFIWTKEGGILSVNDYLNKVMKYDTQNYHFASVLSMSHNGRYICGWGINNDDDTIFAYQMDLLYQSEGVHAPGQAESIATVYPNPVSDILHVDLPFESETQFRLVDAQGRTVLNERTNSTQNNLSVQNIEPGIYILEVITEGMCKTHKIKISH